MRRLVARDYILRHPHALNEEIVRATGTSERTVSYARGELRREGLLQRARADHTSSDPIDPIAPTAPPAQLEAIETSKLMEELAKLAPLSSGPPTEGLPEESEMDVDEMKRRLSRIAKNPLVHPQIQIKAMEVKHKLDYDSQNVHELGPGPPLTRADVLDRLSLMFQACGPELVLAAFDTTFMKGGSDEGQLPSHPGETPSSSPGTIVLAPSFANLRTPEGSGEGGVGDDIPSHEHPDQG